MMNRQKGQHMLHKLRHNLRKSRTTHRMIHQILPHLLNEYSCHNELKLGFCQKIFLIFRQGVPTVTKR